MEVVSSDFWDFSLLWVAIVLGQSQPFLCLVTLSSSSSYSLLGLGLAFNPSLFSYFFGLSLSSVSFFYLILIPGLLPHSGLSFWFYFLVFIFLVFLSSKVLSNLVLFLLLIYFYFLSLSSHPALEPSSRIGLSFTSFLFLFRSLFPISLSFRCVLTSFLPILILFYLLIMLVLYLLFLPWFLLHAALSFTFTFFLFLFLFSKSFVAYRSLFYLVFILCSLT